MVLTDIQLEYAALLLRDLEYLLTPTEEESEMPVILQRVGSRLASQRRHAGLAYADIVPILRIPHWALQAMEVGPSPLGRASFAMYLQYTYYLGLNLADLFASSVQHVSPKAPRWTPPCIHVKAYHQALLQQPPEPLVHDADTVHDPIADPLLVTVDHALMTLTTTGISPTLAALSDMINVPLDILAFNPQVRILFLRYAAARRAAQRRYWRWATYVAVQEAIHSLHEQKQPIALHLICQHTRSTPEALVYYPETATLLEELTKSPQCTCMVEQYEQALIQRVEVARSRLAVQGVLLTWALLAREVGVAPSGLQQYSAIRCICDDLAQQTKQR
jgi:hypothetical protein